MAETGYFKATQHIAGGWDGRKGRLRACRRSTLGRVAALFGVVPASFDSRTSLTVYETYSPDKSERRTLLQDGRSGPRGDDAGDEKRR